MHCDKYPPIETPNRDVSPASLWPISAVFISVSMYAPPFLCGRTKPLFCRAANRHWSGLVLVPSTYDPPARVIWCAWSVPGRCDPCLVILAFAQRKFTPVLLYATSSVRGWNKPLLLPAARRQWHCIFPPVRSFALFRGPCKPLVPSGRVSPVAQIGLCIFVSDWVLWCAGVLNGRFALGIVGIGGSLWTRYLLGSSIVVSPSRTGLFVFPRIARPHLIQVSLRPAPFSTSFVIFPSRIALFVSPPISIPYCTRD